MLAMQETRGRLAIEPLDVDIALEAWARWGRDGLPSWPSMTLLAKVAKYGFTGASQPGPVPEMGELVEAVERGVLRLQPVERLVLAKHYVYWQAVEVSAEYCEMSPETFKRVLYRARRRVADFLDGLRCRT